MNISLWLSLMRIVLQLTNDSSIVHFYVRDHQSSSTFMSSCLLMRNYYLIIRAGSLNQTDCHNLLVETGAFSFNSLTWAMRSCKICVLLKRCGPMRGQQY